MEGPAVLSISDGRTWKHLPFPLSSRAKPRDLQFYRFVLEMFLEDAVWTSRPDRACPELVEGADRQRQPSPGGRAAQHRFPNLV